MHYRVHIINPSDGFWTFHTPLRRYPQLPRRGLYENALVSGIDIMLAQMRHLHGDFDVIMADEALALESWSQLVLEWVKGDRTDSYGGGNWYRNEAGQVGWLCSVLFDYFSPCPERLYVYVVAPEKGRLARPSLSQKLEELSVKVRASRMPELEALDE